MAVLKYSSAGVRVERRKDSIFQIQLEKFSKGVPLKVCGLWKVFGA
jgi:hypothetical protein